MDGAVVDHADHQRAALSSVHERSDRLQRGALERLERFARVGVGAQHRRVLEEDRRHLALGAVQGDRALEALLQLQAGQLHLGVDRHRPVGLHERSQGVVVAVTEAETCADLAGSSGRG